MNGMKCIGRDWNGMGENGGERKGMEGGVMKLMGMKCKQME